MKEFSVMTRSDILTRRLRRLLSVGLLIAVVQQFPIINSFYSEVRLLLYFLFGIMTVSVFRTLNFSKLPRIIVLFSVVSFVMILELLLFRLLDWNLLTLDFTELLIPLIMIVLGYELGLYRTLTTLRAYSVLAIAMGLSLIFYYGQGLQIVYTYFFRSKNQVGFMIAAASIFLEFQLIHMSKKANPKLVLKALGLFLLIVLGFATLAFISNRSSLLGFLVVSLFMLVLSRNKRISGRIALTIIVLVLLIVYLSNGLDFILDFIMDALVRGRRISDLSAISSGRTDGYIKAFNYIQENPLTGRLITRFEFGTPAHHYLINKWVNYGLIFSLPILILYIFLWLFALMRLVCFRRFGTIAKLSTLFLLLSLIVSNFEYAFPYGPGTSQSIVWILIGMSLRDRKNDLRNS